MNWGSLKQLGNILSGILAATILIWQMKSAATVMWEITVREADSFTSVLVAGFDDVWMNLVV